MQMVTCTLRLCASASDAATIVLMAARFRYLLLGSSAAQASITDVRSRANSVCIGSSYQLQWNYETDPACSLDSVDNSLRPCGACASGGKGDVARQDRRPQRASPGAPCYCRGAGAGRGATGVPER